LNAKPEPAVSHRTPWAWVVGTFFGIGWLVPRGGGTIASAVTVAAWWFAATQLQLSIASLAISTVIAAVVATLVGIPAGTIIARELGRKDPGEVVIDEVAGQLIPLCIAAPTWKYLLAAFILFRGFDIVKPPPLRQLERLPGGAGIMLDDVAAGIYALLVLLLLHFAHVL
jgi:phosphatidylglycerophosphatase A